MLKELCDMIGVSGYESSPINYLYDKLRDKCLDNIYIDQVGNLICHRKGTKGNGKVILYAHIDEVGFQVIQEIDKGRYKIKCMGNIKTCNAIQQRVVSNNTYGVIYAKNQEELKAYNYENLYLKTFDESTVEAGDTFTFYNHFEESEKYYVGKALDNRISCYCLYNLIKMNIKTDNDMYYVFTVQEEISMRGIRVAKSSIVPNMCISLDVSAESEMSSIHLGDGIGIKLSDSMGVSNSELVKWATDLCKKNNIKYQYEVSDCGTTEMIISNELDNGSKELGISIPCCFLHCANSIVNKLDVYECNKLLQLLVSDL